MDIKATIMGHEYRLKDSFSIRQQAGAVSDTSIDVRVDDGLVPVTLAPCEISVDGAPFFFGFVQHVDTPEFSSGYEVKNYRLSVQSAEVVLNNRLASESIIGKKTHEIVRILYDNYIAEEGIALGGISETEREWDDYSFQFTKVYELLKELSDDVDASFFITPDKKFYFLLKDDYTEIPAPAHISKLRMSESSADMRTEQFIMGAHEETSPQTETKIWTDGETSFAVGYQIAVMESISVNGVPVEVGIQGIDDDNPAVVFLYAVYQNTITLRNGLPDDQKPPDGARVTVLYEGFFEILVDETNEALRAEIAALNGTSGQIEQTETDETLVSERDASEVAANLLAKYGARNKEISCMCRSVEDTDLFKVWALDRPDLRISGRFMVIERTLTSFFDGFKITVKLTNDVPNARYGNVFNKNKKIRQATAKIYKTSAFYEDLSLQDVYDIEQQGVPIYPSDGTMIPPLFTNPQLLPEFYPALP